MTAEPTVWERLYFGFGEPIETRSCDRRAGDADRCAQLRDRVKAAIEREIDEVLAFRDADPDRRLSARLARELGV